jgi:hypothetical protein
MKTLKRLCSAIALTFVLSFAAFADCPVPGDVNTPPCTAAQINPDDPVVSADASVSFTSSSADASEISEATIDLLLSAMSLF